MGCNDSKSLKRAVSPSDFSKTHKSATNDPQSRVRDRKDQTFQQNRFGKTSRLTPFYQELENMYQECNRDFKKFIMAIEERVSQIYMEISREILSDMNHDEIAAEQSKIIISEEILSLNLNVLKVIGRTRNFQYDKQTFKSLNKFQNNLVGYLKTKYPRGQQTFVSGDLMNHFKQFDRVNDLEYDILKKSNTYFGEPQQEKIVKEIKLFINKLMKECDTFFPEFEKLMQDRAFFIKNQKGEKVGLNYKIGRKIPQNVPKYQKFDTQVLEVTSPQIFRVLIKWMEDLQETIMKTSQKISKKQSFKCYVGVKPSNELNIQADKNEKELLFDYINEYEYSQIVQKLVPKIQDLKPKLQKKNQQFIDQLDEFNQRLLKILNQADPRQKYVPTKQIQTIKYSSFNAKFVQFILTQKLVYTIKQLIKVGQFFISEYMMNLDIIKFRVTDLMRCQVSGNKKQVLQVYKNFQKLQQQGKIQIIKIKNRLSTPLNDAMIIFVIKDCWVICQAQLILTDGGDKADKKSKNTQLVNHYFYELQRSPYGIMAEIAVLLTYKDSKISYENKITFHESEEDIEKCKQKHPKSVVQREEQNIPFICSKCSGFYSKFQNLFKLYQCKACRTTICSKCILRKNPQLQTTFIMRDITRELQQKIQILDKTKKDKRQFNKQGDKMGIMAKQDKSKKSTSKKITPKNILGLFCLQTINMKEIFDGEKKKQGIRKVKVQKLIEVFQNDYGFDKTTQGCYFVHVNFIKGEAGFKLYFFDAKYKQIQNTFDWRQKYDENSSFAYSDYDLLMVVDQYIDLVRQQTIKDKHVFLWGTRKQFEAKINQIKRLTAEGKIEKTQKYKVISIQIKDSSNELVLNYAPDNVKKDGNMYDGQNDYDYHDNEAEQKKDFKYQSLAVLGDKLPALKSARTTIQFDDLGVETKHLEYFRTLGWKHSIKELKITNNKIEDVSIILDNLNSLQRLYFNQNWVKELKFNKPLPNLQILNGTQNQIASIQGLSNILNIRKLLLGNNKLKDFPKCKDLKFLNILNLAENYLSNIENVLKADFPEIQQLILSGQYKENNMQDQQQQEQSQEKNSGGLFGFFGGKGRKQSQMVIEFPKLKNFQSYDNMDMFSGREIQFYSDSLEKISLGACSIERIIFQRRQCLQNLKYLHLNGNKIKYFSFLSVNNQMRHRRMKDSTVSSQVEQDNKPISNESLIELNLSSNEIEYLPVMKFSALKKLELQSNKIKDIQQLKQSKLPELQELYLGYNSFTQMHELYLPKLRILTLENLAELRNTNIIFTGSQMPALEELSFVGTKQMDFSFNLNPKTNQLHALKHLNLYSSTLKNEDKMHTEFSIFSLEFLEMNYLTMKYFPILNLPKVKQLSLNGLKTQSLKNLQLSKLPQLTSLTLESSEENSIRPPNSEPKNTTPTTVNEDKKKTVENVNISKCLTCAFNFPKLIDLSISSCKIGSLKGLESQVFTSLDSIELNDIATLDGKVPKIRAPNATYMKCWYLNLVDCDILFGKDLTKLKRLELQNNQIESISDQALATLTEVMTLSLANNKIKKFACSKNLDKLTLLNLKFNQLTSFPKIKGKKLSNIIWEGNVFTDLSELQNCELPALESIYLQYCDFSKSGLPKLNLPGLQTLSITSCKLINITLFAKSNLPSLRSLDLSYNQIETFPPINFPQLDELALLGNKLSDLKFLKLSSLQGLNTLRLSQNKFHEIPSHQYAHLKIFQCSYVQIESVPALQLPQIQQFTMQYANISDMSHFSQNQYKFLKTLNLCNNQIRTLPKMYMQSLTDLIMNNNQLEDVSDFFDSDVPLNDLAYVSFESNKLTALPNIMFMNIEVLDLGNNPLTEFRALTLVEYPKLTSLYLYSTRVEKIALPRLPVLEEIVISDSKIADLNWLISAAPSLPSLKNIEAQNSKITRVSNLQQFTNLQSIYLSGNPIINVDGFLSSTQTKKLRYVYIDLDVGGDFQKLKTKITAKIGMAVVGNYQEYLKNNGGKSQE